MKRNNVAKKLGIASLCLATAISAFSGISSFKNDSVALAEEATTFGLTDMIHTSARLEEGTRSVSIKNTVTTTKPCLNVSSEEAYNATFTRIFEGNTTFRFHFPIENDATSAYGDFKFRITDATDDSNYFDIVYYSIGAYGTSVYMQYGDQIRMAEYGSSTATSTSPKNNYHLKYAYFKTIQEDGVAALCSAPTFHGKGTNRPSREGKLQLYWSGETLCVYVNARTKQDKSDNTIALVGAFDGTETFTSKSTWGLPTISFPNGYTVSFSSGYDKDTVRDKATGVSFTQINSNGSNYGLSFTDGTEPDAIDQTAWENGFYNYFETKSTEQVEAGKVCIGYKDTATNKLYPNYSVVKAGATYEPVVVGLDRIPGASVRIDTVDGNSGLRFITGFNPDDYTALIEAGYVKSFGTLLAYTDALIDGLDFTTTMYNPELAATENKKVVQVANGSEGGSTFEYTHGGKTYTAYSVALVGLTNFTQSYSARGYIEVAYADGTTAILYTAFNETNNSRSIQQTAYNLIHDGAAEFARYNKDQKNIVGNYANGYDGYVYVPEE